MLIAHILSESIINFKAPSKVCSSFLSQWKLMPIETFFSVNEALEVCGWKVIS